MIRARRAAGKHDEREHDEREHDTGEDSHGRTGTGDGDAEAPPAGHAGRYGPDGGRNRRLMAAPDRPGARELAGLVRMRREFAGLNRRLGFAGLRCGFAGPDYRRESAGLGCCRHPGVSPQRPGLGVAVTSAEVWVCSLMPRS